MTFLARTRACALALTGAFSFAFFAPTLASAQEAMVGGHRDKTWQALQAANLRPDQQQHIQQLIAAERAKVKGEADKSLRKADKKQLKRDIMATLDPQQRETYKNALRQLKEERKAAKSGVAPQAE